MYSNNFKASKLDFKWGNEKSRNSIVDDFAKLRPTSSLVLYLPRASHASCLTCSRAVCASYPKCSRASRVCLGTYVPSCLTCLVPHVRRALHTLVVLLPHLLQVFQLMSHSFHVWCLLCFWCFSYLSFLQFGLRLIIVICHF